MTAEILAFRTEMELPSASVPGNPDMVMVHPDFPGEQQAQAWTQMVADALLTEQGPVTAQAAKRLAAQPAGEVLVNDDGITHMLVRTVASVQRPSGRVAGLALIHMSIHAEYVCTPEGTYVSMRFGAPVMHTAGAGAQTEVLEAALLNLLDQADAAARHLVEQVRHNAGDCVVWSLPVRYGNGELVKELNMRLIESFYALPDASEMKLAA